MPRVQGKSRRLLLLFSRMVATRRSKRLLPTRPQPPVVPSPTSEDGSPSPQTPVVDGSPTLNYYTSEDERSIVLALEPTPSRPNRTRLVHFEDTTDESDEDDYDGGDADADVAGCPNDESNAETMVTLLDDDNDLPNLRCMKDIKTYYKEALMLQPCGIYRTSYDMLDYYVGLGSKDLQAEANKEWRALKQTKQKEIRESIPGPDCGCCKRLPRTDKGKRRGINSRTKLQTRKSKRQRNEEPDSIPEVTAVSLGHRAEDRVASIPQEKVGWVRQSLKSMNYAPTVQLQGGTQARKAIARAVEKTIAAATMSMKEPPSNGAQQPSDIPRVRVLLAVVNEVAETPMHGGSFGVSLGRHTRDKPELTLVSSSEDDCKHVVKALCRALADPEEQRYDKFKVFGTGQEALKQYKQSMELRDHERSKNVASGKTHKETGAKIRSDIAPTIGVARLE